jgi:hypothetical protein
MTITHKHLVYAGIALVAMLLMFLSARTAQSSLGGMVYAASSTAVTVNTSSLHLMASSSAARVAVSVQPVNCVGGASGAIYLRTNDVPATVGAGIAVVGSSTMAFGDSADLKVMRGSINAIGTGGGCTVLITEWREVF